MRAATDCKTVWGHVLQTPFEDIFEDSEWFMEGLWSSRNALATKVLDFFTLILPV